jgi:predicted GH43/DUF377 family glycosyl hydrolase
MENYISEVWPLISLDGVNFVRMQDMTIRGDGTDHTDFTYGIEDVRVVKHDQGYLLIGCGKIRPSFVGTSADRIAAYSTSDFTNISYHGIVDSFDSRNAVPFSESVNEEMYILLRLYPNIHLDTLECGLQQLLAPAKYREYWEKIYERKSRTLLLGSGYYPHEKEKIGPGTQVIRTTRGWLIIYHAVGEIGREVCRAYGLEGTIPRGYSICAALLDLENPARVLCRTRNPIYIPSAPYELDGSNEYPIDVPAVVFPMGAIVRRNKLVIYAGAGDKYVILLGCKLDNLVGYLCEYCSC